jgi:hypothetical protein
MFFVTLSSLRESVHEEIYLRSHCTRDNFNVLEALKLNDLVTLLLFFIECRQAELRAERAAKGRARFRATFWKVPNTKYLGRLIKHLHTIRM